MIVIICFFTFILLCYVVFIIEEIRKSRKESENWIREMRKRSN